MTGQAYRLKDICSIKSGKRIPLGMDFTTEITNYPYIRARDIKGGKIQTDDLIYIDEIVFNKIKKYIIKSGDIAITIVGASVGDVAYAQEEIDGFNLTENAVRLTEFNSIVDGKYLFYVLNQEQYHEYMQTVAGGAAQPKLGIYKVERIKVFLPPLNIQKEIASVLTAYDNLIENNNKRIRLLEQMAENLYKEWFVRFRFPGHEKVEFDNGLPKGWVIDRIGNVCETLGGGTPSTSKAEYWNGNIKWVTPTDITSKNSLPLLNVEGRITEEGLKKSSAKLLPPYTILMTSRASIGFFGVAPFEVCTNQGFISIIPQKENLRMYMLYTLKLKKDEIIANANGSTFLEISKGRFRKMKMVVPIDSILDLFENKTRVIFDEILKIEQQSENLARQRDLLLPRLMSGKLEVNV
ncbi:MAG: restriction endonuclease subunit S [Prevotella ruminicola]|uniref:Restriction endonuclease subunit S n=1 Tax=Xylanibacter ruminicola TaxID=839 RepID=A0A9D5S6E0_XYLRU|nr:restriction endonuclease subunit S [Xylanibacter ruminicola]